MLMENTLGGLIRIGGVFADVEGKTPEEIFNNVCRNVSFPEGFDVESLISELVEREKILSTAVGNGIAIPHPRKSMVKEDADQRIIVCYLKKPMDMSAPDERRVSVMFILLTKSTQFHLQILSDLAKLIHQEDFRKFLDTKPNMDSLVEKINSLVV